MLTLDSVSCGDDYTPAATLAYAYGSNGGSFVVSGHDAFVQLAYGRLGSEVWMSELHVSTGAVALQKGIIGVRFRNKTAGSIAVVTAALATANEPPFTLGAFGGT